LISSPSCISRQAIAYWGLWFTTATLWLLVLVVHEALAANLRQPPQLKWVWWLLGGYMAAVLYLTIQFVVRFRRADVADP
jgi:hypothetical protein